MFEIASIHDRVREFLEEPGSDLPVFDRTALLVHQEATKADPDTDKVISYIVQDQVLVAEVLKVANSSFFRGIKKISRIHDAVVRIGLREVVNCVMMATQRKNYSSRNPFVQQYTSTLWKHSVVCALGAQWLAKRCGHQELAPEAFIAGLIHDVGKLLVLKALVSVGEKDKDAPRITKTAADEFVDTMHPECGFLLLEKWNLPESYCVVCRDHHRQDYDTANILLVVVRLANLACRKLGIGLRHDPDMVLVTCSESGLLGLSDIALAELEIAMEDHIVNAGAVI
jgi:HD-like signal output (HDOD) protein